MSAYVTNIDDAGQVRRLRMGVLMFSVALALTVLLDALGVHALFRIGLFIPYLIAVNLAYQGLFKT